MFGPFLVQHGNLVHRLHLVGDSGELPGVMQVTERFERCSEQSSGERFTLS